MLRFAEGEVTRLRRELKLLLAPEAADRLCKQLSSELQGLLPSGTWVTSVYFDRPDFALARRALLTPDNCLKVRTKEYAPDLGASGRARLVLEVKRERRGVTHKRRVWLLREELERAVRQRPGPSLPLVAMGHLSPVAAVTYERHVYQAFGHWRVTVDRQVAFHPVTRELAFSPERLTPERLGRPNSVDERVVVEVKHLGPPLPPWLVALTLGKGAPYSKFAEAVRKLHGLADMPDAKR